MAPQILLVVLAAMILFLGTSFGYTRMNDEVICEDGRGGEMTGFARGLIQKASITRDANGSLNLRRPARTGKNKWLQTLGVIQTNGKIFLNGKKGISVSNSVMVSPCHILTNHHSVFGDQPLPHEDKTEPKKSEVAKQFSVKFTTIDDEGSMTKEIEARPVQWGDRYHAMNRAEDWALLELDECHGEKVGWFDIKVENDPSMMQRDYFGAWYHNAAPAERPIVHLPCSISDFEKDSKTFNTSCSSVDGTSGSGIFSQTEGERPHLLGLQASSTSEDIVEDEKKNDAPNTAVSALSFYPKIQGILDQAKDAYRKRLRKEGKPVSNSYNPSWD